MAALPDQLCLPPVCFTKPPKRTPSMTCTCPIYAFVKVWKGFIEGIRIKLCQVCGSPVRTWLQLYLNINMWHQWSMLSLVCCFEYWCCHILCGSVGKITSDYLQKTHLSLFVTRMIWTDIWKTHPKQVIMKLTHYPHYWPILLGIHWL